VGESIAPALQGLKIPLASILGNPQGIKFLGSLYSEWGDTAMKKGKLGYLLKAGHHYTTMVSGF
jgi:hypothetical protein